VDQNPPSISGGRGRPTAAGSVSLLLGAVAAVAMVVGAILRWTGVSLELRRFAFGQSASGFRLPDGRVVLGLGVALLALELVAWAAHPIALRMHAAVAALFSGMVVGAIAIANLSTTAQVPNLPGANAGAVGGRIARLLQGGLSVSKGPGLWVALAGGVLAVVAGAMDLITVSGRPVPAFEPEPPAPPTPTPPPPTIELERPAPPPEPA
jgi:hypothetical protein